MELVLSNRRRSGKSLFTPEMKDWLAAAEAAPGGLSGLLPRLVWTHEYVEPEILKRANTPLNGHGEKVAKTWTIGGAHYDLCVREDRKTRVRTFCLFEGTTPLQKTWQRSSAAAEAMIARLRMQDAKTLQKRLAAPDFGRF